MRIQAAVVVLVGALGCTHTLEIKEGPPPIVGIDEGAAPVVIGVKGDHTAADAQGYVAAIAKSLQLHAVAQRVIYPWTPAAKVDVVADVTVTPEYQGSGMNFLVNFPGFLVFAPAWWGYEYHAIPRTAVALTTPDGKAIDQLAWEFDYTFNQADIGRTWTELSWFEVGAIALVGGIVFTRYDTDQSLPFIQAVGASYGDQVAALIARRLTTAGTAR